MPPDLDPSRPRPRKNSRLPFFVLAVSFPLFLLAFFPNPLTDRLASRLCSAAFGRPVTFGQIRFEFPSTVSFQRAEVWPSPSAGSIVALSGRMNVHPLRQQAVLRAREIDLRALCGAEGSPAANFVRQHGLSDWLSVHDSRWLLEWQRSFYDLRLLDSGVGGSSLRGGLRFDRRELHKLDVAFWLPETIWGRFPELMEKRFAQDAEGRRLLKLTWSGGRWRLWGRSAPVLEASWL